MLLPDTLNEMIFPEITCDTVSSRETNQYEKMSRRASTKDLGTANEKKLVNRSKGSNRLLRTATYFRAEALNDFWGRILEPSFSNHAK